jgi:branched-subunit amino acid aminotransferase/4-amino-4-deoxychorismate lyase
VASADFLWMTEIVILPKDQSVELLPTSAAFAHGVGLFETLSIRDGALQFWEAHWERLNASAAALGLDLEVSAEGVLREMARLVSADAIVNGTVKLSLLKEATGTRLFIYSRPMSSIPDEVKVIFSSEYPINQRGLLSGHKTHNYMEAMTLFARARRDGFADRIRLNVDGALAEGCVSNLFFIIDGQLCTPADVCGVLPGVVRGALIECFEVNCAFYQPDVLERAEAVFLTNASWGILPVSVLELEKESRHLDSAAHPLIQRLTRQLLDIRAENARVLNDV